MSEWKMLLQDFKEETELLTKFRVSVYNSYKIFLITINETADFISVDEGDEEGANRYLSENLYITYSHLLDVLNEIGVSIDKLPIYQIDEEHFYTTTSSFKLEDFWDLIYSMDDMSFFSSMIYLTTLNTKSKCLNSMKSIIKAELKRNKIRIPKYGNSVFVAMSFDESLLEVRDVISEVITHEGFSPILIDSKEHNNQIVPEIFNEIDKSKFVIADLTHHKTGVYYEAGYAKGKEKEVIFTCRKDEFEKRHFDVAQTNTIVWDTTSDLKERLIRRIDAMIYSHI